MIRIMIALSILASPLEWIYEVDNAKCNGCGNCLYACSEGAIQMVGGNAYIDPDLCTGCGVCVSWCPRNAITRVWYTGIEEETVTSALTVSANPVSQGSVTVTGGDVSSDVQLFSMTGRLLVTETRDGSGTACISINRLTEGVYLMVSDDEVICLTVTGTI